MTESSPAVAQPSLTREESGTLLGQTMGLVAVTTGLFALGAYLGRARVVAAANLERVFALFPRLAERRRHAAGSLSGRGWLPYPSNISS